jgi:hypothetical protein
VPCILQKRGCYHGRHVVFVRLKAYVGDIQNHFDGLQSMTIHNVYDLRIHENVEQGANVFAQGCYWFMRGKIH